MLNGNLRKAGNETAQYDASVSSKTEYSQTTGHSEKRNNPRRKNTDNLRRDKHPLHESVAYNCFVVGNSTIHSPVQANKLLRVRYATNSYCCKTVLFTSTQVSGLECNHHHKRRKQLSAAGNIKLMSDPLYAPLGCFIEHHTTEQAATKVHSTSQKTPKDNSTTNTLNMTYMK